EPRSGDISTTHCVSCGIAVNPLKAWQAAERAPPRNRVSTGLGEPLLTRAAERRYFYNPLR
ncbi:MAG: hypothetical protein K2L28_03695, partial [Muribaculaceae bacterium]|nr:hypothetical protein [Muribaculaceae bacterium]